MRLRLEYAVVVTLGAIVATLASAAQWVFAPMPTSPEASLWQLVLSDRVTRGFVRMAVIAVASYAIASVPILIVRRRWVSTFAASGVTAEDARSAADASEFLKMVARLSGRLDRLFEEEDGGSID